MAKLHAGTKSSSHRWEQRSRRVWGVEGWPAMFGVDGCGPMPFRFPSSDECFSGECVRSSRRERNGPCIRAALGGRAHNVPCVAIEPHTGDFPNAVVPAPAALGIRVRELNR